jgi:hypothetical protein
MSTLPPPPKPEPTEREKALQASISHKLDEIYEDLVYRNLLRTRRLVEMALRKQVPADLIDHLSQIGCNYYKLADDGPPRPELRVIEGGPVVDITPPKPRRGRRQ